MSYFKHAQHALVNDHVGPTHAFGHAGIEVGSGQHHDQTHAGLHAAASARHADTATSLGWLYETQAHHALLADINHAMRTGQIGTKAYIDLSDEELGGRSRKELEPAPLNPMPGSMPAHRWYLHHNYDN